jgi:hypothetical protein
MRVIPAERRARLGRKLVKAKPGPNPKGAYD